MISKNFQTNMLPLNFGSSLALIVHKLIFFQAILLFRVHYAYQWIQNKIWKQVVDFLIFLFFYLFFISDSQLLNWQFGIFAVNIHCLANECFHYLISKYSMMLSVCLFSSFCKTHKRHEFLMMMMNRKVITFDGSIIFNWISNYPG